MLLKFNYLQLLSPNPQRLGVASPLPSLDNAKAIATIFNSFNDLRLDWIMVVELLALWHALKRAFPENAEGWD